MGCGCKKGTQRPAVARTKTQNATPQAGNKQHRTYAPLRFFLKGPDGSEQVFNTLAEAQQALRRLGGPRSGWVVEPRRTQH